jgi:Asp/Glu/hydantoin racemase
MTSEAPRRIALIHALPESVAPVRDAFARLWPEAYAFDVLDSSLAVDLAAAGTLDAAMIERFAALGDYAAGLRGQAGRTAAILFTCSAFGPAIDAVAARLSIPVLKPNEAAFERALALGDRIGLVATFCPALPSLSIELERTAARLSRRIKVHGVLAEGALAALKAGDGALHDRLAAEAAASLPEVDAIVLGQFSLARAAGPVRAAHGAPVLATPDSAVAALRARLSVGRDDATKG